MAIVLLVVVVVVVDLPDRDGGGGLRLSDLERRRRDRSRERLRSLLELTRRGDLDRLRDRDICDDCGGRPRPQRLRPEIKINIHGCVLAIRYKICKFL